MRLRHLCLPAAGALLLAASIVGCTGADGPPAITLDRSACGHCRMLVSELRTAAAWRTADGTMEVFDDIGCLLDAMRDQPAAPEKVWVHEAGGEGWLEADAAAFTFDRDVWTPMGSGLLAWPEGAAPAGAVTRSFAELLRDETSGARGVVR